ncbi:hypothetical protein AKJ38_02975 [candidate division MSBL1 archaeon SCGC-AAA259I14]|uniref:Xanthine dehydrogenase n=1 Tax=candidate division MSBL1 archaeon SCGC-AAA259I14 TaxID=1698268 RepID=A0A133UR50_9EURY|nr:hypothetical protein AKJ38_02975 [candidate division MSBL1 archaeon SCGC-AAA259I14]
MKGIYQRINELLNEGERFAVATIIRSEGSSPRGAGAKMIVQNDGETIGSVGGDCAERGVIDASLKALENGEPRTVGMELVEEEKGGIGMKCGGEIEVSIEILEPSPRLVLIGGGRVAIEVAKLAEQVGFEIRVIDPFVEEESFPDTAKVIPQPVSEGISEVEITSQSYIVIITRHKYDQPALTESLETEAAYIGMMGSETRVKSIFGTLEEEEGIERERLSEVHAPIGLEIGAETPKEIAVSIVSELIKERRCPECTGESSKIGYKKK